MATNPIVITERAPEPSIAELRAMVSDSEPEPAKVEAKAEVVEAAPEPEPVPDKPERKRDENGKFTKAESEGDTQEPEKTVEEEPLPANVQKRIAKEVEKQARSDREIAEHVSRTKAKQAELERLKTTATGSEPATNTETVDDDTEPEEPVFGREGQTWGEFQAEMKAFRKSHDAWLVKRTERTIDEKLTERQRQEKFEKVMAEAEKTYGKGFDEMRSRVVDSTPEGLQIQIGALDDWPSMVAYLGKPENADEMTALSNLFNRNELAAVRELGRMEDRLKQIPATKETVKVKAEKPLPAPPVALGGGAAASPKVDLQKADMKTFKREMKAYLNPE